MLERQKDPVTFDYFHHLLSINFTQTTNNHLHIYNIIFNVPVFALIFLIYLPESLNLEKKIYLFNLIIFSCSNPVLFVLGYRRVG